jgi:hypothetical protein
MYSFLYGTGSVPYTPHHSHKPARARCVLACRSLSQADPRDQRFRGSLLLPATWIPPAVAAGAASSPRLSHCAQKETRRTKDEKQDLSYIETRDATCDTRHDP